MFVPWRWISRRMDDKPVITEKAALYSDDTAAGVKEIKFIYNILGILDSKASALMQFDGILLAVLAIVAGSSAPYCVWLVLVGVALLVFLSIASCICIIDVSWPFLAIAVPSPGQRHIDEELRELRKVMNFREGAYRGAWFLSALAMILMFIGAVLFVAVQPRH